MYSRVFVLPVICTSSVLVFMPEIFTLSGIQQLDESISWEQIHVEGYSENRLTPNVLSGSSASRHSLLEDTSIVVSERYLWLLVASAPTILPGYSSTSPQI